MSTESVMPSNRLILCHPLLLLPSVFPSLRVFSKELALCISQRSLRLQGPLEWLQDIRNDSFFSFLIFKKYWSFSISPSNEYSGLIFFRLDWFDLRAVQGTLKSVLWPFLRFSFFRLPTTWQHFRVLCLAPLTACVPLRPPQSCRGSHCQWQSPRNTEGVSRGQAFLKSSTHTHSPLSTRDLYSQGPKISPTKEHRIFFLSLYWIC